MPQVAVRSEHTLISSMRMSPDRTVYGCVLAEVLSSGWRWPDLRLGIPICDGRTSEVNAWGISIYPTDAPKWTFLISVSPGGPMTSRAVDPEALLTPAEVAALFRVDPKTVTRWANDGKLTSLRTPGGHRRYRESEVRNLLGGAGIAP